jgi:hypothetical protein
MKYRVGYNPAAKSWEKSLPGQYTMCLSSAPPEWHSQVLFEIEESSWPEAYRKFGSVDLSAACD